MYLACEPVFQNSKTLTGHSGACVVTAMQEVEAVGSLEPRVGGSVVTWGDPVSRRRGWRM